MIVKMIVTPHRIGYYLSACHNFNFLSFRHHALDTWADLLFSAVCYASGVCWAWPQDS